MGLPLRTALNTPQEWNIFRGWLLELWDYAASLPYFEKARGPWLPNVSYASNDYVTQSGKTYVAMLTHMSGSDFAADVSAGRWLAFNSATFSDLVAQAVAQVGLAGAARVGAEAARTAAELARDASFALGPKYATDAIGRAAVADGATYLVQGAGDVAAYEYRRTSSTVSVMIASYPSSAAVSPANKSIKASPNLFNYRTVIAGKINQSNSYYGDNAAFGSTPRIPVLPGEVYYFTVGAKPVADTTLLYSAAVSATMADNPITIVPVVNGTITIPAGAYFLSLSAILGFITDPTLKWQLTKGAMPTRYFNAGYFVDPDASTTSPLYVGSKSLQPELDLVTSMPSLINLAEFQLAGLTLGKNLYRHVDWQWGFTVNTANGNLNASGSNWVTSTFFAVVPSVLHLVSVGRDRTAQPPLSFAAYYDESQRFINTPVSITVDSTTNMSSFTPPAGARFMRVSAATISTADAAASVFSTLMVSVGYAPFELYGYSANETTSRFKDADLRALLRPLAGKRAAFLGDSITMQGRYFSGLCRATGIDYKYSNKTLGVNGAVMATRADDLTPALLADIDLVTVLAGTNDYGHGNVPLGAPADLAGANTFYGSIYTVINKILAAKSTVQIVFFTPLQRGAFGAEPNPYAAGYPHGDGPGSYGLTMPAISQAIVTACRLNAIPCLDLFSVSGCNDRTFLNYYAADDLLHPVDVAADKLGLLMGKFINSVARP